VEKSAKASAITNRFFNMMNASSCQPLAGSADIHHSIKARANAVIVEKTLDLRGAPDGGLLIGRSLEDSRPAQPATRNPQSAIRNRQL